MKSAFSRLGLVLVSAMALSSTMACEVTCGENEEKNGTECVGKSLKKYNGQQVDVAVDNWASGGIVTVNGVYGNITVEPSENDSFSVSFQPFNYRAFDAEADAVREMEENLVLDVVKDGTNVTVNVHRQGDTKNGLGAAVTLWLPNNFDGKLVLDNDGAGPVNPGNITANYVGSSPEVVIVNDKLGDCTLKGAATVTNTSVTCDGSVWVEGVSDNVNITATGLETDASVVLKLAGISPGATGGTINAEDGDVFLTMPATGDYSVQAQIVDTSSINDGVVNFGSPPSGCTVQEAAATSQTLTCNAGGPNYKVNAGLDAVGDTNIVVDYQ